MSIQLPSKWFNLNGESATVEIEVRILESDDSPIKIGLVTLHSDQEVSVTNSIGIVLPSQPIVPGSVFVATAYGHASYAIATYSVLCYVSGELSIVSVDVDDKLWLHDVGMEANTSIAVVAILKQSELANFDQVDDEELLFTMNLELSSNIVSSDMISIQCEINYLSNVLNQKVIPSEVASFPYAAIFDYNSTNDPFIGSIMISSINVDPVGLISYLDQAQVINLAYINGISQTFSMSHFLVNSDGQLDETINVNCSTNDTAFHLAQDCSYISFNGSEETGVKQGTITVTHQELVAEVYVRVWYPFNGAALSIDKDALYPVENAFVRNSSNNCIQLWEQGKVQLLVEYSYDSNAGSARTISLLPLVVDQLMVVDGPGEVDANGEITPLSNGSITVSAGPKISSVTIAAIDEPQEIKTLGLTIFSGLSVTLPTETTPITDNFKVSAAIQQTFDSVTSQVHIIAGAILSDGYSVSLTHENGLRLTSSDESVLKVSDDGDSLYLVSSGQGELVTGEWASQCTSDLVLAKGSAYGTISVSDPLGVDFESTSLRVTHSNDYADIAGVPTQVNITVSLKYVDNFTLNIVTNSLLNFTVQSPHTNSVNLIINSVNNTISLSLNDNEVLGNITLLANYNNGQFLQEFNISAVKYSSLSLSANPYPSYDNSDKVQSVILYRIYPTSIYQQAQVAFDMVLTDNTLVDITNSKLAAYSTLSAVITPTESGQLTIEARFGSIPDVETLNVTVSDKIVTVTEINSVSIGLLGDTLSGIANEATTQLQADVVFNDTTTYPNFLPDGTEVYENVLNIESSVDAVNVGSTGTITLVKNHHELITVVITSALSEVSESISFACNLEPEIGDIDIGSESGVPVSILPVDSEINLPIRINAGDNILETVELLLFYDNFIEVNTDVLSGSGWANGVPPQTTINKGAKQTSLSIKGEGTSMAGIFEFALLQVTGVSAGLAEITGIIQNLVNSDSVTLDNVGSPIVAGAVTVEVIQSIDKRDTSAHILHKREVNCDVGDIDGNCYFDTQDIQYLLTELSSNILNNETLAKHDIDNNMYTDPSDAYYLYRVLEGQTYLLQDIDISPASSTSNCILEINATLTDGKNEAPDLNKTVIYFDFSLPLESSFTEQDQLDGSFFHQGTIILSPKSILQHGAIIQAEQIGITTYTVSMVTNLTSSDIGLSVIIVTLNDEEEVTPGRVQALHGSPYSPFEYIHSLDIELTVSSNVVPLMAPEGYSALDSIDNSISAIECKYFVIAKFSSSNYIVAVPENASVNYTVVKIELSVGSLEHSELQIISGNDNMTFILSQDGSLILDSLLDYETKTSYILRVESSANINQTIAQTTIIINITDINDNSPTLQPIDDVYLISNTAIGTTVFTIIGMDNDDALNGMLYYIIVTDPLELFSINPVTGDVVLNKTINVTDVLEYNVTVGATDLGKPPREAIQQEVTIIIEPYVPPSIIFSNDEYSFNVSENEPDVLVGTVQIELFNVGNNVSVDFSILNNTIPFIINQSDGSIMVIGSLDREKTSYYVFDIEAQVTLTTNQTLSTTSVVLINVVDVNDNTPQLYVSATNLTLYEDASVPQFLDILVSASDNDISINSLITYSIVDSQQIMINSITGEVSLVQQLDYETQKELEFTIVAADNGYPPLNSSVVVTVIILDVNDNPPQARFEPESQTVNRSIPVGFVLAMASFLDKDSEAVNGNNNVSLQHEYFEFNEDSMEIRLVKSIANITDRSYNLSIEVIDISNPVLTSVTFFVIYIDDDNLNTPRFLQNQFTFVIPEDTSINATIVDLNSLVDPIHRAPDAILEFSILNPNQDVFDIDPNGELYLSSLLDFEMLSGYILHIVVTDVNHEDFLSSTSTINITITDVNDNKPLISVNNTELTILATTPINTVVLSVQATDIDSGLNSEVDVSLVSDSSTWVLVNNEITLNETLNIGNKITFILTVVATDRGIPPLTSDLDIAITTDPFTVSFDMENYMTSITENNLSGIVLLNVTATSNLPSLIIYSLVEMSPLFSINNMTGEIITLVSFDFEEEELYEFQVQAVAIPIDSIQSVTTIANITIVVVDANDNPPYFSQQHFEYVIEEDTVVNETIVDLESLIADEDTVDSEVQFILQANEAVFGINENNELYLRSELDYENQTQYNFTVLVRDLSNPALDNDTALFNISVTDINDNSPILIISSTNITISATTPVKTSILQVSSTDLDSGNNGIVDLSLSDEDEYWALEQNNITLQRALDIAEDATFALTITATDQGSPPLSSSQILYIFVDAVEIFFLQENISENVTENAMPSELISVSANLSASNAQILYSLSDQTQMEHGEKFSINNETGILSTVQALDYEELPSYTLTVRAMAIINSQTISTNTTITITVIDVNDNPPVFRVVFDSDMIVGDDNNVFNITTEEEKFVNLTVSTSDLDSPINSEAQFGVLEGADEQLFALDVRTNTLAYIISNSALDREVQGTYNISVLVTNEGYLHTLTATAYFLITLSDANDNTPTFTQESYNVSLFAPIGKDTLILDLNATDFDIGANGLIVYSLIGSSEVFRIDSSTGILSTNEDILSENAYTLIVIAIDSSTDAPQSSSATVAITISSLINGRQNDFTILPDTGLGIVNELQHVNSANYSLKYGFILPNSFSEHQNISISLGTDLSSNGQVQVSKNDATSSNCILVQQQLWEDNRILYIAAQVQDNRNRVQTLPTTVTVQLQHPTEGHLNTSSNVDTSSGTTVISVNIPSTWFTSASVVSVSCGIDSADSLTDIGEVLLVQRSELVFGTDTYVYMELPISPLLPGSIFEIPVYAETGDVAIGTYALQINCSDQFEIQDITVDSSLWVMASETVLNQTDILFTGLLSDPVKIFPPGKVRLATIKTLSIGNQPNNGFSLTVHFIGTTNKEKILPPPGVEMMAANASTYNGIQFSGEINATTNSPAVLFIYATTTHILNTAILTGEDITIPLTIVSVLRSGELVDNTEALTCSVSHPDSFQLSEDCSSLVITSSHSSPIKDAIVTFETANGVEGLLTVSIWTPLLPGNIQILDPVLNLVSNWVMNQGCDQQYQRSKVIVSTNFTNSVDNIDNIIITHLVSYSEDDPEILSVNSDNGAVTGLSTGTTSIRVRSKDGIQTVGDVTVIVSSSPVQVEGLDIQVVESIVISPQETTIDSFEETELTITTRQGLDSINAESVAVVTALYSDGQRNIISLSEGLEISSLNTDIVEVEGNTVNTISNGSGVIIDAEWKAVGCGDKTISIGKGYVNVVLPEPLKLRGSVEVNILAPVESVAENVGVASSTMIIEATVEFSNGEEVDVLNSVNTVFSLTQPSNGISLDDKLLSISNDAAIGEYTILVRSTDYGELNTTIDLTIVEVVDLNVSAKPYPLYANSDLVNVNELKEIASSGLFQQAIITVDAVFSNVNVEDVSTDSNLIVALASVDDGIEAELVNSSDGFIMNLTKVVNSGMISLSAMLFNIPSSINHEVLVSTDSLAVISISILALPNDTLSGVVGTTQQIIPTVTLADGSVYSGLFQDIDIPSLVRFEQSPAQSSAFTIDQTTGIITLMGNSKSKVSVTVTAIDDNTITASTEFSCNLEPTIGDIDLGNTEYGLPVPVQSTGTRFTVPLHVNTGSVSVDYIEVSIFFDYSIIQTIEVTKSFDWPSDGVFGYTKDDPRGSLLIAGTFGTPHSDIGSIVHLVDIEFEAVASGFTYLNGTVHNLIDNNGLTIGNTTPRATVAGVMEVSIQDNPIVKRSIRHRRQLDECETIREAGDVDGDCVFDVRDVAYLQSYYLSTLADPNQFRNVSEQVERYLDCDMSGVIDLNDALYMLRVAFKLYQFVDTFQLSTVMEEKCYLNISISSIDGDNNPAQMDLTAFLAYFTHTHPDFRSQFNQTNFTYGTVLNTLDTQDVDIVLAEYTSNGMYRITADASLLLQEVGVSIIQVTFNSLGDSSETRVATLTQEPQISDLHPPFNFTVTVSGQPVSVYRQSSYTPLMLFNNTLTTFDCIALMAPVAINQSMYTVNVNEGTALNTSVLHIGATVGHPDAFVTFSIDATSMLQYDNFPFVINEFTGVISTNFELDFEGIPQYVFVVHATENRTSTNASTTVVINVININDLSPVFNETVNTTIYIPSSAENGYLVINLNASDPDMLDTILYTITASTIDGIFTINELTGTITVNQTLYPLNNTEFVVQVTAADPLFNQSTTLNLFIYLPFFTQSIYQATVFENATLNTTIATVKVSNAFVDVFSFSIVPDYGLFSIDSEVGVVILVGMLDYDKNEDTYTINITAISENFHLESLLLVTVLDVNDNPPIFSMEEYSIMIPAHTPLGTTLNIINVTDADSLQHATLQYSINQSEDSHFFTINQTSGQLTIVYSLLNALHDKLNLTVLVNDSVYNANATILVHLSFAESIFPVLPSLSTNMYTFGLDSLILAEEDDESHVIFTQQIALLPAATNNVIQTNFGGLTSIPVAVNIPLNDPVQLSVYLLHYQTLLYHYQSQFTLLAQVRDVNHFTVTIPTTVDIKLRNVVTNDTLETSCMTDYDYGQCIVDVTIPPYWFETDSIIELSAALDHDEASTSVQSQMQIAQPENVDKQLSNYSVIVYLPPGNFMAGEVIEAVVYATTQHVVAGFSLIFDIDSSLVMRDISFNSTRWGISMESNDTTHVVIGILSSPDEATTISDGYTALFTLQLQVLDQVNNDKDCLITATVASLADSIEGPVLTTTNSRSGPVYFLNTSGLVEVGLISTVIDRIVAVLPYIDQSVVFNTAVLSGVPVELPIEIWAGYSSGALSMYTGDIETCESSNMDVLKVNTDCKTLLLLGNEQESGTVHITLTIDGISGTVTVIVYYPSFPMSLMLSDDMVQSVQLSLTGNCDSAYQITFVSVFADFSNNESTVPNVDITESVQNFITISDESIVNRIDSVRVTGVSAGSTSVCTNTFNGNNNVCTSITVIDDPVFVSGLSVAIYQGFEVVAFENISSESFLFNVSLGLDSMVQNVSMAIVALQYTDDQTRLIPTEEFDFQSLDSDIVSINSEGQLVAHNNGTTNVTVTWVGSGVDCELELVKNIPIEVVLSVPSNITVFPSPSSVHRLTSENDSSSVLGIPTNYTIRVWLEYDDNVIVETDALNYNISDSSLVEISGDIIRSKTGAGSGFVNVTVNIGNVKEEIVLQFNIVSTMTAIITATPFPTYENSDLVDIDTLAPIQNTLYWQQCLLGLRVTLTDGFIIEATEVLNGNIFTSSIASSDIIITITNNTLVVRQVNVFEDQIAVMITPTIFQFNEIGKNMMVVSTPIAVSNVTIGSLPNDTLTGIRGYESYKLEIAIFLEDALIIKNILSVSEEFNSIVTLSSTSASFSTTSSGYLIPLLNTDEAVSLMVTVAGSFVLEIAFNVNLNPNESDLDLGAQHGSPLDSASVGNDTDIPLYINTGNNSLQHFEISFVYDSTVFFVSRTELGEDWSNGLYHFDTDKDNSIHFTSVFPEQNMIGERIHLCTITLTALIPTTETMLGTEVVVIGYHDDSTQLATPYNGIASNITVSVAMTHGIVKREVTKTQHMRSRRDSPGCITPPCDCEKIITGDLNIDCLFDSTDVSQLLTFLKQQALLNDSYSEVDERYDLSMDLVVDVHDIYISFKALIGYVPLLDYIDIIPIQSIASQCLLTVKLNFSGNLDNINVYLLITLHTNEQQKAFEQSQNITGKFVMYHQHPYGGVIQATRETNEYKISLSTPVTGSIGVSVIVNGMDSNNQTTSDRIVQYLGPPPPLYTLEHQLMINTSSLYVSTTNGYSPLVTSMNEIESSTCSNLPLIGEEVDIVFTSPYNATVIWELDNLREGLSLSSLIQVRVTECELTQTKAIVESTCQELDPIPADSNTTAMLMTEPFMLYRVTVVGTNTSSNETTGISPEAGKHYYTI